MASEISISCVSSQTMITQLLTPLSERLTEMAMPEARFEFGKNWRAFIEHALMPEREEIARQSIRGLLRVQDLAGRTFLDVGAVADYFLSPPQPRRVRYTTSTYVAAAGRRQEPGSPKVGIVEGSVLDRETFERLARRHVYSWGVLHHTGRMWEAIRNAASCVERRQVWVAFKPHEARLGVQRAGGIKRFYVMHGRLVKRSMEMVYTTTGLCASSLRVAVLQSAASKRAAV